MPTPSEVLLTPVPAEDQPSGLCVLVVEDDEADAYLISRALARQPSVGLVMRAPDGVEALRMVEQGEVTPDLAFIDLHMPRKNGFNLLAAFAGRAERGFPMVVLTSSTAPTDAVRSRLRGAMRVVSTPETVEAMETALAFAIAAVCPLGRHKDINTPAKAATTARQIAGFPGIRASVIDEISERP
jgi:CheY-like chemotaxis protein